jgi:hypothetical protein
MPILKVSYCKMVHSSWLLVRHNLKSLPQELHFRVDTWPYLQTLHRAEMAPEVNHSSLLCLFFGDEDKKIFEIDTCGPNYETFYGCNLRIFVLR